MAFDGIVTKAIASELQQLSGARIDKIFQPNSNNVVLGFYLAGTNYALNICTNSPNYRLHLTTHPRPNPKVAPNFCMVLRKHLLGLHIKNIITNNLERIVTIEFEGFDDVDDIICKKLIVELMGKHCNIILLDDDNTIIDSLRHINNENTSRIIVPHIKYTYPQPTKQNFLECTDFNKFENAISLTDETDISTAISNTFNGFSKSYIDFIVSKLHTNNLKEIYNYLEKTISKTEAQTLRFEQFEKDYFLVSDSDVDTDNFALNFFIDDFYYEKETSEDLKSYRNTVLKLILSTLKKYNKRLQNINKKLEDCSDMDKFKLYGELITANLYKIKNENVPQIELENYYDNNNIITIKLDPAYTPAINAKRFFKKYNKLKNALEIVGIQKDETLRELNYIESIVYELEVATSIEEISDIYEEISENVIFKAQTDKYKNKKATKVKKSSLTKNKTVNFNPIKYTIDGFTLLVGRNNKENDYLTLKYARKNDLWFHTKDIHGSHAILILNNVNSSPSDEVLTKCAEIAAFHSKARLSSNVPVDFCEVRFVKKPNGAKPGMVIYTNNSTLYVTPKIIKY